MERAIDAGLVALLCIAALASAAFIIGEVSARPETAARSAAACATARGDVRGADFHARPGRPHRHQWM